MVNVAITLDGVQSALSYEKYSSELFRERPEVIALRVNGELRDLNTTLVDGDSVETISISSEIGRAHV